MAQNDQMKLFKLFKALWRYEPGRVLWLSALDFLSALMVGMEAVLLIPLLQALGITQGPNALSVLIERYFPANQPLVNAALMVGLYFFVVCCKAAVTRRASIVQASLVEDWGLDLRGKMAESIRKSDYETHILRSKDELSSAFFNDSFRAGRAATNLLQINGLLFSSLIQIGVALLMSPPLTLLVLALGALMLLVIRPTMEKSRVYGQKFQTSNQNMTAEIHNQWNGFKELRGYGVEIEQEKRIKRALQEYRDAMVEYTRLYAGAQAVLSIGSIALIGLVCLLAVFLFKANTARLVVLIYVFGRLWPLFSGLQSLLQQALSFMPSYQKVLSLLEESPVEEKPESNAAEGTPDWETLSFCNVSFSYRGAPKAVLHDIRFDLNRGRVLAFAGRNGAGKSTLADLVMGYLSPTEGEIKLDGHRITMRSGRGFCKNIGYVPQDPLILNASLRENLMRFHPNASLADFERALKDALAWDFVNKLPEGPDTLLGDRGARLSGGERQRIVLARALMGRPGLLILDEATNALDGQSEGMFRKTVENLRGKVTLILIAHQLSTILLADEVLVLEGGTIAERGRGEELLKDPNSCFKRLLGIG